MTTTTTHPRTAIVLGGSGSVGGALLHALFHDEGFGTVITLSRRSLPEAVALARATGRRLVEKLVPDMAPTSLAAATLEVARAVGGELEGFSVLGVGADTAKLTLEAHRAVDVALNEAFARALRDSGQVRHLAFMSAAGARAIASKCRRSYLSMTLSATAFGFYIAEHLRMAFNLCQKPVPKQSRIQPTQEMHATSLIFS